MTAADWTTIGQPQDIRLVVADMDGTLLDERSRIPDGFWPMLAPAQTPWRRIRARVRTPIRHAAQHVRRQSRGDSRRGRTVLYRGKRQCGGARRQSRGSAWRRFGRHESRHRPVDDAAASGEHNVGLVVCGLKSAYVQRSDKPFLDEVGKYYAALSIVDDLHEVLDFAQEPSA